MLNTTKATMEPVNSMVEKYERNRYEDEKTFYEDEEIFYEKVEKIILHKLDSCKTFDEKCSLFLDWEPAGEVYLGISADIAEQLLNSEMYSPLLYSIWETWRYCWQMAYETRDFGNPPNCIYNAMRKKCDLICLKRIKEHPDDISAMYCAISLAAAKIYKQGTESKEKKTKALSY